jgi:hypothetical protein
MAARSPTSLQTYLCNNDASYIIKDPELLKETFKMWLKCLTGLRLVCGGQKKKNWKKKKRMRERRAEEEDKCEI